MGINDLPKAGAKFNVNLDKAGSKSLRTSLGKLSRRSAHFKGLSRDNVNTIVGEFGKSTIRKAIRLKGGLSRYQVKRMKMDLYKARQADPGGFSKEDVAVGKEIIGHYSRAEQAAQSSQRRPRVYLSGAVEDSPSQSTHYGSISSLVANKNPGLGGATSPDPSGRPKPPRIAPSF